MSDWRGAVDAVTGALLGRHDVPDDLADDLAARLAGVVTSLRALEDAVPDDTGLALSWDPAHPSLQRAPARTPESLLDRAGAGTGYAPRARGAVTANPAPSGRSTPEVRARDELADVGAGALAAAIARRELSPVEAVDAALARIDALDGRLNAFVTVLDDDARTHARRLADEIARGEPARPVHGVPVAIKDIFDVASVRTTAGSKVYDARVATADATAVERLRAAGAVVVGKTATHEFAFGVTTDSPYHGPVCNPWDTSLTAGGSSGGSAAAVAARMVPCALGTDTGGSIRIPAAACGVAGLKPTFGLVAKDGVVPLSWTVDHVGPLATTVADAALVLDAIAGPSPGDPTSRTSPGPRPDAPALRGVRVGVDPAWTDEEVDERVAAAVRAAIDRLRERGADVRDVKLPPARVMALVNRVVALAEGGSYHAPLLAQRASDYGADVRARFELGGLLLARDYVAAQRLRVELTRMLWAVMRDVDALVTPAIPMPAPPLGLPWWRWDDGVEAVPDALIRLTAPFSLAGFPAVSVPVAAPGPGAPCAAQVVARPFEDHVAVALAAAVEAPPS
ncbi:MAG TPA: amidase [Actinomycetota bacterium]|nr:amidase [Actinomycetota bacterium]